MQNRDALSTILNPIVAAKSSAFWLEQLEANNIGCGPINDLHQVFENPQVKAREMVHEMMHSANGGTKTRLLASPIRLSQTPVTYRNAPPLLGEHTDAVLEDVLCLDAADIAALREAGALG